MNAIELGSRASFVVTVNFVDTNPAVPVFTNGPVTVDGTFQIGLGFGESVTGLNLSDFVPFNVSLDSIVPDGDSYFPNLTPLAEGLAGI